ncbi:class I SAM-dependent methyltransferase [Rhodomicrobium vannielii ATCC 17100]|uniref:SAM-dependent methyltransferase n=1 Tax=Rhodomicrobium vannielii TaxID=1069 RepID=UPI0019195FE1|nr:cyclopropane-fatty-acyl-phospholipid synthase family protein [Rhodomicrobium vannielii]MBJ7535412.1 class I SAM-dependent methyltransferase [Rhodomicrobium vannielii ATCC 17100]
MVHEITHHVEDRRTASSWPLWQVLATVVREGHLRARDCRGEVRVFGDREGKPLAVRFVTGKVQRAFLADPQLGFAEGWMDGDIEIESGTLYELLALFAKNLTRKDFPLWMRAGDKYRRLTRFARQWNDTISARRNVKRHYDLPGALYELFLDKDRQYSCAYFEKGDEPLDEAQIAKKQHIAKKLCLAPRQRVLDIGCGWGGLALHLARERGARVVGVTLSEEQEAYAKKRIEAGEAGAGAVDVRLTDYRSIDEKFDRIVSVGMFEHVGVPNYRTFFRKVEDCLEDDGVALLHTIGRLSGPGHTNAFIAKYIFPGGYIPSLSEIVPSVEKSGLLITDVEVLRLHYADTLASWRQNFERNRSKASAMLSERFCRMWEYYLAGCEVSFRYYDLCVFQIQLAKRIETVPTTRAYLCP